MPRRNTWAERRPIPSCQVGVLHAFGPGYLHAPDHVLEFRGSKGGDARRLRINRLRELRLVCLYGPVRVTAGAIRLVTDAGAGLAYLSSSGLKTNGILQPPRDAWRTRRYRQYQAVQDGSWTLHQARRLVEEKLRSHEESLLYMRRQGRADPGIAALIADLPRMRAAVAAALDPATLLGLEGMATKRWFQAFDRLLPDGWTLPGRRKRPPTDPVNALLSFGYTLLFHRVQAACQAWGLDPAMGFFHEYHPGRDSLACDLMEPFRVPAVDRLVLRMLALKSYHQEEFIHNEGDFSVRLIEEALKRWTTDLEMHLHAADEDHPSLQVQIVARVGELVDALPSWNGRFPGTPDVPGAAFEEGTFLPPSGHDESDFDPPGGMPGPLP
jgi:CRISP-associated protein Cas1